jgi:signal transduction histidine kinase/AmiR/NasT family two-component response regulator
VSCAILKRYEAFLRIDECTRPWDKVRARGVYVVAWLFAALQVLNLIGMTYSYGGWTFDHTISAVITPLFIGVATLLRWSKNFLFFLTVFAIVSLGGALAASMGAGIHSALLPFIAVGPMMAAFLSGWRAALVFGALGLLALVHLLTLTLTGQTPGAEYPLERTTQRFLQAAFAVGLGTSMSALLSWQCQNAFQRLEAALEQAALSARAKDRFLANMSHELRTPMNGVLGLTEAVMTSPERNLTTRQETLLRRVKDSGEHLLTLLNDLLDASRIEAGKLAIEPRAFDLRRLVTVIEDTLGGLARSKGLTFTIDIGHAVPEYVLGDDTRLRQILSNLISNSVKFTEEGEVSLRVRVAGENDLVFTVSDTGRGIPPESRSQIFERFEQGEAGTTRAYGGTGLGLAICRDLSELMGGSIRLLPGREQGTSFEVVLPLPMTTTPTARPGDPGMDDDRRLHGLRVLVAEDNLVNRMVLDEFLKRRGIHPVFAENGLDALQLFDAANFDLALIDRQMPGLDGEAVVEAIRARSDAKAATPLVAVTADVLDNDRNAFLEKGADGFVAKPIKSADLYAAIEAALVKRDAWPALRGEAAG